MDAPGTGARSLGVADRVAFRDRLDRESGRATLWDAHAFVLPSPHKTFGDILLEAMATGLPVVATVSDGPEDIVAPEVCHLVSHDDTRSLTEALLLVAPFWSSYNPDAIRQHTVDRYGPEPFVDRTRLLYRRALESG